MGFRLPDIITFWQVVYGSDGQATYPNVGVTTPARTASKSEELITTKGKERKVSKLAVYFDSADIDLKEDDYIKVGDFTGELFNASKPSPDRILAESSVPSGTTIKRVLV